MENGSDGRRRDRKDAAHESEMDRGGAMGVGRTGEAKRVGGLSRPLWFILFNVVPTHTVWFSGRRFYSIVHFDKLKFQDQPSFNL